ncbi:Hypothetical predicted protein, partial [Pelobates cultripes]
MRGCSGGDARGWWGQAGCCCGGLGACWPDAAALGLCHTEKREPPPLSFEGGLEVAVTDTVSTSGMDCDDPWQT